MRLVAVLTAAVAAVVLAPAGGDGAARSEAAAGPRLVRVHEPSHGWTALLPAAWASSEVGPQFVRGLALDDPTRILLWTYRGRSPAAALRAFATMGALVPGAPSGVHRTPRLVWERRPARVTDPAAVELAVARDGKDAHVAALFTRPGERDALVRTVLLPALDSFVPGRPDPPRAVLANTPPAPAYWPTAGWRTASPAAQGLDAARLDALVGAIRRARLPIDSVTVVRHGYVVLDASFGAFASGRLGEPYATGGLHHLHSATKSVTSALVGIALAGAPAGVGVETPVLRLLGPYRPAGGDARKQALTVEHLLTMQAGLRWREWGHAYEPGAGNDLVEMIGRSENWTRYVLDRPMATRPGSAFVYNSGASHVLSAVVNVVTGGTALELARERVFGPLGIRRAVWATAPEGVTTGWGNLRLQPRDLVKLGFLYLHGGRWAGRVIVPRAWVRRSTTDRVADPLYEYGYQWWLDRADGYAFMTGRFGQLVVVSPERDLVAVVTAHLPETASAIGVPRHLVERYVLPAVTR